MGGEWGNGRAELYNLHINYEQTCVVGVLDPGSCCCLEPCDAVTGASCDFIASTCTAIKKKEMPSASHSFESCKSITISYLVSFSPSARSMQIQARQNMPLAGFYGSELMNAANEAGWRQQGRGPGHYFAHVPAPAAPFPFPSPTAMHCGLVSLWLHGTPLVGPQTTAAAVCNNSNNLSPRAQIMHELNCA